MKIQFKKQKYQTEAVKAVVDCFAGQPNKNGIKYQIDPGVSKNAQETIDFEDYRTGFKNEDIVVNVLENIKKVQQRQWKLHISQKLIKNKSPCEHNLDVEMETGTGKTYVYIKTMYELHKSYGWSKFIIVVPSVAIREGIGKSFEVGTNTSITSSLSYWDYDLKQTRQADGSSTITNTSSKTDSYFASVGVRNLSDSGIQTNLKLNFWRGGKVKLKSNEIELEVMKHFTDTLAIGVSVMRYDARQGVPHLAKWTETGIFVRRSF